MRAFSDIFNFLKSLRFVDVVFFFAILILMILIITLIYFIMANSDEEVSDEEKIANELKKKSNESVVINLTNYEKEQEDKAIISYDELLSKGSNYSINYEKEEYNGDVSIKKVDLDNFSKNESETEKPLEVRVISFAKEEAFLQALRQLSKELG